MLITDTFRVHGSVNDSSHLRKHEIDYRHSLFSENLVVFMALRKSSSKLQLNSSDWFAFNCYSFCSLITNSNQSKFQMASSKSVCEPIPCMRLLPYASYLIECICFKKFSVIS